LSVLESLKASIIELSSNQNIRVIILENEGPAFSSGHDLCEIQGMIQEKDRKGLEQLFEACSDTMMAMVKSPKPIVAKVNGVATAAGCQLVASADLAYASLDSTFATPGVNIGLFCSTPAVALGRCVSRKAAMQMLLLGQPISALRAQEIGLVNQAVPREELDDAVDSVSNLIAEKSPTATSLGKPLFYQQLKLPLEDAYKLANQTMVDNALESECQQGIDAFFNKQKPIFKNNI
jgi:enoyl-CoA hydratase/carnithine racemase